MEEGESKRPNSLSAGEGEVTRDDDEDDTTAEAVCDMHGCLQKRLTCMRAIRVSAIEKIETRPAGEHLESDSILLLLLVLLLVRVLLGECFICIGIPPVETLPIAFAVLAPPQRVREREGGPMYSYGSRDFSFPHYVYSMCVRGALSLSRDQESFLFFTVVAINLRLA